MVDLGDDVTAHHLLREIDDVLRVRPRGGSSTRSRSLRTRYTSPATTRGSGTPPADPAELRLLPYLQTYLSNREIGERLFVSRNTASTEIGSIYRKLGVSRSR